MATAAELEADLALFKTARDAILSGAQSYSIGGHTFNRANLDIVLKEIARLEARICRVKASGRAVKAPVFGA